MEIITIPPSPVPKTPNTPQREKNLWDIKPKDSPPAGSTKQEKRVALLERRVATLSSELQNIQRQMHKGVSEWWPAPGQQAEEQPSSRHAAG